MTQDSNEFYDSISAYYDHIFPYSGAQGEFVNRLTGSRGAEVLDAGCATGSLVRSLAGYGHSVTGFDLDEQLLKIARTKTAGCELSRPLSVLNLLETSKHFSSKTFDVVCCFGNTLAHLPPSGLSDFLHQCACVLKFGGILAGQVVNYDRILRTGDVVLPLIDNDVVRFDRTYSQFSGNDGFDFRTRLTIKSIGRVIDNVVPLFPVYKDELEGQLRGAGFSSVDFFSDFKGSAYEPDSFPLVFSATS